MAAGRDRTRLLKGFLLVICILILGGISVMFSAHRQQTSTDQLDITAEKKNATIAMEGIHHTEISNGAKDWELEAESADYHWEEKITYLSMLQAIFFDENGENDFLSAESGALDEDSNDLEVSGNVVLKNSQCVIQTERMKFNKEEQEFVTESHVSICYLSLSLCLEADGMTYPRATEKIKPHRNVTVQLGNDGL